MEKVLENISIEVCGTDKKCPVGERVAAKNLSDGKIPVFSCEGACIRGEIARLAANLVAKEEPYRRGCHGELLTIPSSSMASWVGQARRVVLIDGCFLKCQGRILENMIDKERLSHFDAFSRYQKYADIFDIDAVPEADRKNTAEQVAGWVLDSLRASDTSRADNA